jgi:hypothetical protein
MRLARYSPTRFFARNIEEIASDPALRVYGAALAMLHVLSFVLWRSFGLDTVLSAGRLGICWPFFERCADYRFLTPAGVRLTLWLYLAAGVAAFLLFASRRLIPFAYWALVLVNLFKIAILIQDYRLRLNQHYMALIVSIVFLFIANKRRLLQYQVVAFYFWAGILKLDREWLSGEALYRRPLGVPQSLVPLACAYVVLLESVLVFGLLARRAVIFWATFAQFALFHITSWTVVGYFYPLVMFAILAVFPLARFFPAPQEPPALSRLLRGREPASTLAFLSIFSFLQIVPWLFPGDTAITGEGRLFALHMFDAKVVCEGRARVHGMDGKTVDLPLDLDFAQRIRCDPIVYLSLGRVICRRSCQENRRCTDLDLTLEARRSTEPRMRTVIDIRNFCTSGVEYNLLWPNAWILK